MRFQPRKPWLRRAAGQVIIPAMILFPTFMLFVYLIFETAKLSREKIRHQFAIDAAVFVEMTNYSDFLNRTAYVNGAFPMRIFDEGFKSTMIDCDQKTDCAGPKSLWEIMCKNGDFPVRGGNCLSGSGGGNTSVQNLQASQTGTDAGGYAPTDPKWDIRFGGDIGAQKNTDRPELGDTLEILSMDNANKFWISWDDAQQVYKLYVQIYQLLGSVEDAQYSVLYRLSESSNHNFLRKSYWLNTGDQDSLAASAAAANTFGSKMDGLSGHVKYECYSKINFYGNKPTGNTFQPWQVFAPQPAPTMPSTIANCSGLFHFTWVKPDWLKQMKEGLGSSHYGSRGIEVSQAWQAPSNYFIGDRLNGQEFFPGGPIVHVTVAIDSFGGAKAAVWPDPTPKFQVRTYP